jgi:hypothetical protein
VHYQGDDGEDIDHPVFAADRAAWLAGADVPAWQAADNCPTPPLASGATPTVAVRPGTLPTMSWADVLFERSGGRGNKGFVCSPERLPMAALVDALSAAGRDAPALSAAGAPALGHTRSGLRLLVVLERVAGIADGLYEWRPATRRLELLRPGSLMLRFEEAYPYPATQMRLSTANAGLLFVVDFAEVLARQGPRGLRVSQLEMGSILQSIGLAATTHGVFVRPLRAFDPDRLAELADLPRGTEVAYTGLLGRSRFVDLMLDLRP